MTRSGGAASDPDGVTRLQRRLVDLGWTIAVDGVAGPRTTAAVRQFQRGFAWSELVVDGRAGPRTWEALERAHAAGGRCSPHFTFRELACDCRGSVAGCIGIELSRVLVAGLEAYRALVGRPVRVVSGYRDPEWNARNGGATSSQHLFGNAADIEEAEPWQRVLALRRFSGIGIERSNGRVRHVDVRHVGPDTTGGTTARPTLWYYG